LATEATPPLLAVESLVAGYGHIQVLRGVDLTAVLPVGLLVDHVAGLFDDNGLPPAFRVRRIIKCKDEMTDLDPRVIHLHDLGTGHVRKVPQLRTIVTSPSASMRRSAATTVLRATPYSLASCATEGSRSCGCHSPALIRARSAASTRRLGNSGVRSDGIQP